MIVDEEYFLQHYGKKGMKWGVRKASKGSKGSKPKRLGLGKQAVLAGTTFAAALATSRAILRRGGSLPLSMAGLVVAGTATSRVVEGALRRSGDTPVSEISR